jgi:polynucleotide 5'-hydroxyl-kinase GRC3/NOL9
MEILVPKEWYNVLNVLEKEKGVAILLGATDTGKSTLAKFLITHLYQGGVKVALVDADIGQSSLGPPTTIGLALFDSPPNWERNLLPEIFFVGSNTPEGHILIHLNGAKRMVEKAISYGAEVILVDTTGFILGESGKELKRKKIDLLSPQFLLALQRSGEVENILMLFRDNPIYKIHRLPISEQARSRSYEERRTYRMKKFQEYFMGSDVKELAIDGIQLEGKVLDSNGFSIPLEGALWIIGLLLGLKDLNDDTLALGVIENYVEERRLLRVSTPLQSIEKVKTIQLGSLRLTSSYEEENF